MAKTKLELTWIGKENRPKPEPRILLEDGGKSYHAPKRVTEGDPVPPSSSDGLQGASLTAVGRIVTISEQMDIYRFALQFTGFSAI